MEDHLLPGGLCGGGEINPQQIRWWKHLYFNGLGEFFYVNGIQEAEGENFMEIRCQCPDQEAPASFRKGSPAWENSRKGFLVPIGGGKDSAVTLELLKQGGNLVYGYIINPRGASLNTARRAGLPRSG